MTENCNGAQLATRINPCYIAGAWRETAQLADVDRPYGRIPYAKTFVAGPEEAEAALQAAVSAAANMAKVPSHQRAAWINLLADGLEARADDATEMLVAEAAKPRTAAREEVMRAVETLRFSAVEALKLCGEGVPLDASSRGEGRLGLYIRVPVGVVLGITPYNAPLNLLAHKIGPALAAGNSFIAKPDLRTPSTANLLVEIIDKLDLPSGAVQLVHGAQEIGRILVSDQRVDLVSFTGGKVAALDIHQRAGLKRVTLELGGNAATIVCADADIATAAQQIALNGFGYSGQSCIAVQRVYIEESAFEAFTTRLLEATAALKIGDPADPRTDIGPMIDTAVVARLKAWIDEAIAGGARLLCGGEADGNFLAPTILTGIRPDMKVVCEEVFGPVVVLHPVTDLSEAFEAVNNSQFGMQAGIFTGSVKVALSAVKELQVGGIIVNGTSNYRVDNQPYGGIRLSGVGREGPAFAIEEMSEIRMVVLQ